MNALADGCPSCFPGDAPAAMPRNLRAEPDGTLSADYCCVPCGITWRTCWRVTAAWPERRDFQPVSALLTEVIGLLAELLSGEEMPEQKKAAIETENRMHEKEKVK